VVDQAKQAVGQVKEQVKGQVTQQANTRLDDQKQRVSGQLSALASSLDGVTAQLREQNPALAGFAETAVERLNTWSSQLEHKDVGELLDDIERFARRNPALFVGGAFALGLLGARFLKSTAPSGSSWNSQYRGYGSSYDYAGSYPTYGAGFQQQGYETGMRDTAGYGTAYGSGRTSDTPTGSDATTRAYGTTATTGTGSTYGSTASESTRYSPHATDTSGTTDVE